MSLSQPEQDRIKDSTAKLPDELIRYILIDFVLSTSPPPTTRARVELHSGPERARGKELHRFSSVCKRFRAVADDVGEAVVHLQAGASLGLRQRTAPVRRLCLVVKDLASLEDPLPTWLVRAVRSLVFSLDLASPIQDLPPLIRFLRYLPATDNLTLLSEGAGCVPSDLLSSFTLAASSISTLRLGHVERFGHTIYPRSLTCLQFALSSPSDLPLLDALAFPTTLRHLHVTSAPPACPHTHALSPFYPILGPVTSRLRNTLSSFTYYLSEPDIGQPNRHLLDQFLSHAHLLERLDTSRGVLTDEILLHLPLLPRLGYLRLVRSAETPPSNNSPEHWSWGTLAKQSRRVLQNEERSPDLGLLVVVKCEGTLRKYDVAQRSCRAAYEEVSGVKVEGKRDVLRVHLEYWEDRPAWQAWPHRA